MNFFSFYLCSKLVRDFNLYNIQVASYPGFIKNKMTRLDRQELLLKSSNSFGCEEILGNDSTLIKKLKSGSYHYGDLLSIRDTLKYCIEEKTEGNKTYDAETLMQILEEMLNYWMYEIFDRDYYNKTS